MIILQIADATRILGKSQGYIGLPLRDEMEEASMAVGLIEDTVNGLTPCMVTAWEPTPAELEKINKGAPIYLRILGTRHPPVMLLVGDPPK